MTGSGAVQVPTAGGDDVLVEQRRHAFELTERIMANAPVSVQASKRSAREITDGAVVAEEPDWERSRAEGMIVIASADASEGMMAFAEKRSPRWQGR